MLKHLTIFILILLVPIILFLANDFNQYRITAQFDELEPIRENIGVYYKGFKLGNVKRVYPSENFEKTNVDMILRARNINLPDNITAKIRVRDKHEYLELIYPKEPNLKRLNRKSIIKGEKSFTLTKFFEDNTESGDIDEIKENLNSTIVSAGSTFDALTELIIFGHELLKETRPSLVNSIKNLEKTSQNLVELSRKLNNSVEQKNISNIIDNIEKSSINLNTLTYSTQGQTLNLLNTLLKNSNCLILNINDIINGFKNTLNQRFGTIKFIFGKPIN